MKASPVRFSNKVEDVINSSEGSGSGSGSGTGTGSSSTTTGLTSTGVIESTLLAATQVSRKLVQMRVPRWWRFAMLAVELAQLLLLPLETTLHTLGASRTAYATLLVDPTTVALVGVTVRRVLFWVLLVPVGLTLGGFTVEFFAVRQGAIPHVKVLAVLAPLMLALRPLTLPAGFVLAQALRCADNGALSVDGQSCFAGVNLLQFVVGVVALTLLGVAALYDGLFHHEFRPTHSALAVGQTRSHALFALLKLVLVLGAVFAPWSPHIEHGVRLGVGLLLAAVFTTFSPFLLPRAGTLFAACTGPLAWAGLAGAAVAWIGRGSVAPTTAFVLLASGLLPAALVTSAAYTARRRYFERALKSPEAAERRNFSRAYEVGLALRRAFRPRRGGSDDAAAAAVDPELRAAVDALFANALVRFPSAPEIPLLVGLFRMTMEHAPRAMNLQARAALRLDPAFDTRYIIETLLESAQRATRLGEGPEMQQQLDSAARHESLALTYTAKFWQTILRSHELNLDIKSLMKIVRDIDTHDKQAGKLLNGLLRRYPTSSLVLRRNAAFHAQMRSDHLAAEQLYTLAEECERRRRGNNGGHGSRRHHAHNNNKRPGGRADTLVSFAKTASDDEDDTAAGGAAVELEDLDDVDVDEDEDDIDFDDVGSIRSSASSTTVKSMAGEAMRLGMLRRRVEASGTESARRVHFTIVVMLGLLYATLIGIFVATTSSVSEYVVHMDLMNATVSVGQAVNQVIFDVRAYEQELLLNHTDHALEAASSSLRSIREFELAFDEMFKQSSVSTEIQEFWTDTRLNIKTYVPGVDSTSFENGTFVETEIPLWDSGYSLLNSVRDLVRALLEDPSLWSTIRTRPDFRYIFDNAPSALISKLKELGVLYAARAASDCMIAIVAIFAILPVAAVSVVLVYVVAYRLSEKRLRKERGAAVALLLDLPKSAVVNIHDKLVAHRERHSYAADADDSNFSSRGLDSATLLHGGFLLSTLALLAVVGTLAALVLNFAFSARQNGEEMRLIGMRGMLSVALLVYAQELTADDFTTFSTQELLDTLDDKFDEFNEIDAVLKYGDASGLGGYIQDDLSLYGIWYETPCPEELRLMACYGVGVLLRRYLDAIAVFYREPHPMHGRFNPQFFLAWRLHRTVTAWLEMDKGYMRNLYDAKWARTQTAVNTIFWLALPLALVLYLALRLLLSRLRGEITRVFKMLLFVPSNVLENVASIKEFMEGGATNAEDAQKASQKLQEEHTRRILDACDDAVVVCDSRLTVTIFNPAAEKTLGCPAGEALGADLEHVLNPGSRGSSSSARNAECTQFLRKLRRVAAGSHKLAKARKRARRGRGSAAAGGDAEQDSGEIRQLEMQLTRSSGETIPTWVSVAISVVNGVKTVALFVRDMTELKERERVIEQERRRAQALLLNILPASIAELLQKPAAERGDVIAQEFNAVTVLFADIVQFTPKSAAMTPDQLVLMLHSLFSAWDALSLQFGVEKIKTIGDCYMCVAGAPEPYAYHAEVMMDFALAMLAALRTFNKDSAALYLPPGVKIAVRVGLNTGRVVAGVIGSHKFQYDLWGDAVNVAARMESSTVGGCVQVSEATFRELQDLDYPFEKIKDVQVKSHGSMTCYRHKQIDTSGDSEEAAVDPTLEVKVPRRGPAAMQQQAAARKESVPAAGVGLVL